MSVSPDGWVGHDEPVRVLAIGPHADDIELGCGGTLLRLVHEHGAEVHFIVLAGANDRRHAEAIKAADLIGASSLQVFDFPDTEFPNYWRDIKDLAEKTLREVEPAAVFYPHPSERHQDHRAVAGVIELMPRLSLDGLFGYQVLGAPATTRPSNLYVDLGGAAPLPVTDPLGLPRRRTGKPRRRSCRVR